MFFYSFQNKYSRAILNQSPDKKKQQKQQKQTSINNPGDKLPQELTNNVSPTLSPRHFHPWDLLSEEIKKF